MGEFKNEDMGKEHTYTPDDERIKACLLDAVQMAYRKHWLEDDSVGWDELGTILLEALCVAMGDDGYQKWLKERRS